VTEEGTQQNGDGIGVDCKGHKGPLWVYVQESKEERQKKLRELEEENRVRQERITFQQAQARIPGTEEYEYLAGLNRDIAEYNRTRKPGEPRKMSCRPEWEFKEEPPIRRDGLVPLYARGFTLPALSLY